MVKKPVKSEYVNFEYSKLTDYLPLKIPKDSIIWKNVGSKGIFNIVDKIMKEIAK